MAGVILCELGEISLIVLAKQGNNSGISGTVPEDPNTTHTKTKTLCQVLAILLLEGFKFLKTHMSNSVTSALIKRITSAFF